MPRSCELGLRKIGCCREALGTQVSVRTRFVRQVGRLPRSRCRFANSFGADENAELLLEVPAHHF